MDFIKGLFGKEDKEKPKEISINENLLILPAKIIQISNISKMTSYVIKKKWYIKLIMFLVTGALWFSSSNDDFMVFLAVCSSCIFIYLFLYKRYGVQIQTNGGTNDILITKNQSFADELFGLIAYAINNRETLAPITIENYYDNPNMIVGDLIMGDVFSNIQNSTIINRPSTN